MPLRSTSDWEGTTAQKEFLQSERLLTYHHHGMDLDGLRALIAVADSGSFSAAAKSLKFAGATLRKQIDELEAKSGVELLKRATDGVLVTRAGEMLAEKGRSFLVETRALVEAVRALEQQDDLIRIQIPLGLPPHIEQAAYKTFRKAAPRLRWHLSYIDGPFAPNTDATFIIHYGDKPTKGEFWRHTKIGRMRTGLVASEDYLKKNGRPTTLEELQDHAILVWERHDRDPRHLPLTSGESSRTIRPILVSPSAYLIQQFVASGSGIALAPSSRLSSFLGPQKAPTGLLVDSVQDNFDLWMSVKENTDAGAIGILAHAMTRFVKTALGTFSEPLS